MTSALGLLAAAPIVIDLDDRPGVGFSPGTFIDPPARLADQYLNTLGASFRSGGPFVGTPDTISAYDVQGALIATDTQPDIGGQTFQISVSGIHKIVLPGTAGTAMDDVKFKCCPTDPRAHRCGRACSPGRQRDARDVVVAVWAKQRRCARGAAKRA
jgi:hypothetical protein